MQHRVSQAGAREVWLVSENPGTQALTGIIVDPNRFGLDALVQLLLEDKGQQPKIFTEDFFKRHRDVPLVKRWQDQIFKDLLDPEWSGLFSRDDLLAMRSTGRSIPPPVEHLIKLAERFSWLKGAVVETKGWDRMMAMNALLQSYFNQPGVAEGYLNRGIRADEIAKAREDVRTYFYMARREEHCLDLMAEIAQAHPKAHVLLTMGSAHRLMRQWLDRAPLDEDSDPISSVSWVRQEWTWLRLGRQAYESAPSAKHLIKQVLENATATLAFFSDIDYVQAEARLQKVLLQLSSGELTELYELILRHPFTPIAIALLFLQERGHFLDESQHPSWWKDIVAFRLAQYHEVVGHVFQDYSGGMITESPVYQDVVDILTLKVLGHGLTEEENRKLIEQWINRFVYAISRPPGYLPALIETTANLDPDETYLFVFTLIKKSGVPGVRPEMQPRVLGWFEWFYQNLKRDVLRARDFPNVSKPAKGSRPSAADPVPQSL